MKILFFVILTKEDDERYYQVFKCMQNVYTLYYRHIARILDMIGSIACRKLLNFEAADKNYHQQFVTIENFRIFWNIITYSLAYETIIFIISLWKMILLLQKHNAARLFDYSSFRSFFCFIDRFSDALFSYIIYSIVDWIVWNK